MAIEDNAVIGIVLAGHDGRRGYIYHMSVAGNYRKQGIGTQLVKRCVESLEQEGINKMALFVFQRNETRNAFWEKQGFSVRKDITYRNKALDEIVRIDI